MKRIMILAMAVAALASCKKEQSELNFSDIQGSAIIKGQVTYNAGVEADGSGFIVAKKNAANIPVIAKVAYDSYSDGAIGTKIIETTTDANGNYSISIPCTQKSVSVEVEPRSFVKPFGQLSATNNLLTTNAYYEATKATHTVVMGDEKVQNFTMAKNDANSDPIMSRTTKVHLKGKVKQQQLDGTKGNYGGCELMIKVENTGETDKQFTIKATTDQNGDYETDLMLFDNWDIAKTKVTVSTVPVTGKSNNGSEEKAGYWPETKGNITLSANHLIIDAKVTDILVVFTAVE